MVVHVCSGVILTSLAPTKRKNYVTDLVALFTNPFMTKLQYTLSVKRNLSLLQGDAHYNPQHQN